MSAGATAVGRPKKGDRAERPPKSDAEERETIIHMKGSREYSDFLDVVHRKSHIPKVQLFRIAYAEWCERNGFGTPPKI
jgi:hypothetical protein